MAASSVTICGTVACFTPDDGFGRRLSFTLSCGADSNRHRVVLRFAKSSAASPFR
jgi:hypothetical protein